MLSVPVKGRTGYGLFIVDECNLQWTQYDDFDRHSKETELYGLFYEKLFR